MWGKEGKWVRLLSLKCHSKEPEFILEPLDTEASLEQSNMIVHFRNLILQLIGKSPKARRLTSIIHILDEENGNWRIL